MLGALLVRKQGTSAPFCASACWWRCPQTPVSRTPSSCGCASFCGKTLFQKNVSAERRYFQKLYLRKMPLSLLLFLCSVISLFHWIVQNPLHVRPNGQQFAHLILCVSILGIILFSLHCQDFIFRLQRLNSRELRQFSLIKSGSVKFFL